MSNRLVTWSRVNMLDRHPDGTRHRMARISHDLYETETDGSHMCEYGPGTCYHYPVKCIICGKIDVYGQFMPEIR